MTIEQVTHDRFESVTEVKGFGLFKHAQSDCYILSFDRQKPRADKATAFSFPRELLLELAYHTLRTVAPTTDDRILDALNRIEQLLRKREQ